VTTAPRERAVDGAAQAGRSHARRGRARGRCRGRSRPIRLPGAWSRSPRRERYRRPFACTSRPLTPAWMARSAACWAARTASTRALGLEARPRRKVRVMSPMVAGAGHPGKDVDDDQFVRAERPGAALVRIAGLVAAGDDRAGRNGPASRHATSMANLSISLVTVRPRYTSRPGDAAAAQDPLGGGEPKGAAPIAFPDGGGLGAVLISRSGNSMPSATTRRTPSCCRRSEQPGGKIVRHGEAAHAVLAGEEANHLGRTGAPVRPGLAGALVIALQRQDVVEAGGFPQAAEFECPHDGDPAAATAEGHKGIGHLDAAKIEGVGTAVGVGVEERRGRGWAGHGRDGG
jgi:hypothetical protein